MWLLAISIIAAICGAPVPGVAGSGDGPQYPKLWGDVPLIQTADYGPLPGGYGFGSSTMAHWVAQHMEDDKQAGRMVYPPAWGEPPRMQTRDLRPLPFGYGQGSGTLRSWMIEQAKTNGVQLAHDGPDVIDPRVEFSENRAHVANPHATSSSSSTPVFPSTWGPAPTAESRDYRALPGGYGHGSSTLATWISLHMAEDAKAGVVNYPPAWGAPPMVQTLDLRPLPLGYGQGSGTLLSWICEKAVAHGYAPEELSAAEGDLPVGTQANQRGGTRHQRHG